jgi:hypothetical protein
VRSKRKVASTICNHIISYSCISCIVLLEVIEDNVCEEGFAVEKRLPADHIKSRSEFFRHTLSVAWACEHSHTDIISALCCSGTVTFLTGWARNSRDVRVEQKGGEVRVALETTEL